MELSNTEIKIVVKNMAREMVKRATVKNASTGKSPWMMRVEDWLKYEAEVFGDEPKKVSDRTRGWHKGQVLAALSEGKNVPAEVLKDYPDLQKRKR
jgi:hypothetical protein